MLIKPLNSIEEMVLGLSESLPSLVSRRFATAKADGALLFSTTEATTIHLSDVPFQLRYCPALAKKPTSSTPPQPDKPNSARPDPFQNPSPDLLIAEIPTSNPTHFLVLNKFPVILNHFILATREYRAQTDLLDKEDLKITYSCLAEWALESENENDSENCKRRLFAFFNSGEHSGASQPHRHLQFLPVEDMACADPSSRWTPLIDRCAEGTAGLPFKCYAAALTRDPTAEELYQTYMSLYEKAVAAVHELVGSRSAAETPSTDGRPAAISYNLAMTTSTMVICPRTIEYARLPLDKSSSSFSGEIVDEGLVKLNGTTLAGTLMVKAESEWMALKREPRLLESILKTVAIPRDTDTVQSRF